MPGKEHDRMQSALRANVHYSAHMSDSDSPAVLTDSVDNKHSGGDSDSESNSTTSSSDISDDTTLLFSTEVNTTTTAVADTTTALQ
jgi:hypothetical protein